MTTPHTGMASVADLELLHTLTCTRLTEALQAPAKAPAELLLVALRFLMAQPYFDARRADATEVEKLETLRALHMKKVIEAASVDKPPATVLVEIRRLIEWMEDAHPSALDYGDLPGAELPFQDA